MNDEKRGNVKDKKVDSILGRIIGIPRRRPSTVKRCSNEEDSDDISTKNDTISSITGWIRYVNPLTCLERSDHGTTPETIEPRKGTILFVDEKKEIIPGETRQSHFFDTLQLVRRKTLETMHIVKKRSRPMIYCMPTWLLLISGLTCWFVFNSNRTPQKVAPTLSPSHEPSIAP